MPQDRGRDSATAADGLALGIGQACALVPGVSRNGATLAAARWRRFTREDANVLSRHAALPLILAATGLKGVRLWRRGLPRDLHVAFALGTGGVVRLDARLDVADQAGRARPLARAVCGVPAGACRTRRAAAAARVTSPAGRSLATTEGRTAEPPPARADHMGDRRCARFPTPPTPPGRSSCCAASTAASTRSRTSTTGSARRSRARGYAIARREPRSGQLPLAAPTITHCWPPDFAPGSEGPTIAILPWEVGAPPRAWVHAVRERVDRVWVPSAFVRDGYVAARHAAGDRRRGPERRGPGALLARRPGAHAAREPAACTFLFVGGTIWRKGIDVLLAAWARAFGPGDDVRLVVKDFGVAQLLQGPDVRRAGAHARRARRRRAGDLPDRKPARGRAAGALPRRRRRRAALPRRGLLPAGARGDGVRRAGDPHRRWPDRRVLPARRRLGAARAARRVRGAHLRRADRRPRVRARGRPRRARRRAAHRRGRRRRPPVPSAGRTRAAPPSG